MVDENFRATYATNHRRKFIGRWTNRAIAAAGCAVAFGIGAYLYKHDALPGQEQVRIVRQAGKQIDSYGEPGCIQDISDGFLKDPVGTLYMTNRSFSESGVNDPRMFFSRRERLFLQLWSAYGGVITDEDSNVLDSALSGLIRYQLKRSALNLVHARRPSGNEPEGAVIICGLDNLYRFILEYNGSDTYLTPEGEVEERTIEEKRASIEETSPLVCSVVSFIGSVANNEKSIRGGVGGEWGDFRANEYAPTLREILSGWGTAYASYDPELSKMICDLFETLDKTSEGGVNFESGFAGSYPETYGGNKRPPQLLNTLKTYRIGSKK